MNGYHVIDADGHVFETIELYEKLARRSMPSAQAKAFASLIEGAKQRSQGSISMPHIWAVEGRVPIVGRSRPLGPSSASESIYYENQGTKPDTEAFRDNLDPAGRLRDMDREGIDAAVVYPSSLASFCALRDRSLEAAIYEAYNRWCADYCSADPKRLKYVAVVSLRDIEAGVAEAHRAARDSTMAGIYCQTHIDGTQLDQPHFDPLWAAAQELDLPVAVHHASAALPPYGLGVGEMNECWWLMHACSNPFEQMRAIATMIGGGVFERFPKLRAAFLEAGCGWLPYWLDRLDEHRELMPYAVPLMKRDATEVFASGRCFISFEPGECMLPYTIKHVSDDAIVFASDYPHFDGKFPRSVKAVVERKDLSDGSKRKLLSENAKRLYTRMA